MLHKEEKLSSG